MATTIIFRSFEYTLLDSSRLSMDPDFVRGGDVDALRFTPMILQLQYLERTMLYLG